MFTATYQLKYLANITRMLRKSNKWFGLCRLCKAGQIALIIQNDTLTRHTSRQRHLKCHIACSFYLCWYMLKGFEAFSEQNPTLSL